MEKKTPKTEGSSEREGLGKAFEAIVPDIVKKALFMSLGGVFMTEEAIRKNIKEFSMPKDVANYLVQQSSKSKDEIMRFVADEFRKFVSQIQIDQEIRKVLAGMKIQVQAEVRFVGNDAENELKPSLKIETQVIDTSEEITKPTKPRRGKPKE